MKLRVAIILVSILYLTYVPASGQHRVVNGRVIDSKSLQALPFATVYLNQTTIGTPTDVNGRFQLQGIEPGEYDLVVSYVGYQPYHKAINLVENDTLSMTIQLVQVLTSLGEVQIQGKKDAAWEQDYRRFTKMFFGEGQSASLCKILNPWQLEFKKDKDGTFHAECREALEIENLATGYRVTYLMKGFQVTSTSHNITGYVRFQEMLTPDSVLARLWSRNRHQAYLGSPRHLFKSMVENELDKEGFVLYEDRTKNPDIVRNSTFQLNINESITAYSTFDKVLPGVSTNSYTVRFPSRIEVHFNRKTAAPDVYRNVPRPVSWLEVTGGSLTVSRHGTVLNPSRLVILGAMSELRVADLLPYDYLPPGHAVEKALFKKTVATQPIALLEKPYLHTDKPYYYRNDLLLFKAYMGYTLPLMRDSLSHVLHVQLADVTGKIVVGKIFPITNGAAAGDLFLGNEISPGDYQLRAFTSWMLNFDQADVFLKSIRILPNSQLVKSQGDNEQVSQGVNILTSKDKYLPREKVLIALEATDDLDNLLGADLSISIVDAEQAASVSEAKLDQRAFEFTRTQAADTTKSKLTYAVQYGIPFSGKFVSKRKKHPEGIVSVYQGYSDDALTIRTDTAGRFYRELQVMDTTALFVDARSLKGKPGKVTLDSVERPVPDFRAIDPMRFEVYTPGDPAKYHIADPLATATMLENITIEGRKVSDALRKKPPHVDISIEGEAFRLTTSDVLSEIQKRVPGLRVMYKKTGSDIKKYVVLSGGLSTIEGGIQEPMVLLDGIPFHTGEETVAEQLAQMNPGQIEKIEVLKFGNAAIYGARSGNGVLVITTRNGSTEQTAPARVDRSMMQAINLPGYASTQKFDSPDYSLPASADDRLDVRSTLYWNPWVTAKDKENITISFYAADIPTRYRIVVEGLSRDRKPYRAEKVIVVGN